MAKKDKKDKNEKKQKVEHIDYPMRMVFQVSLLAACVSFILLYLNNIADLTTVLFRSFLVFIAFAVGGGALVIIIFTIMANNRQREQREAEEKLAEELRTAEVKAAEERNNSESGFSDFGASVDNQNSFSL